MARKNLLASVTGNAAVISAAPAPNLATFPARGAPGSIGRSIGDLAAKVSAAKELEAKLTTGQVIVELDTKLIDPSFIADRMDAPDDEAYLALKDAIAREGQGSPILVRPHPTASGRYQVAFGHRRLRAAKDLGKPVRAVVRTFSDQELVVAQGQENSVRADLSFIERACFAQSLIDLKYGRDTVMAALAVDKTTVSKMLAVTARIPSAVIEAIGPAPAIGRDRWVEFANQLEARSANFDALLASEKFRTSTSDERFRLALEFSATGGHETGSNAEKKKGQGDRQDVQTWSTPKGDALVTLKHNARSCVLNIDRRQAPDFGDFLLRQMDKLYDDYLETQHDR